MSQVTAGIHKMLVRIGKTLIRLLLNKQSDLGLQGLSRHFWQATSVLNFRVSTILIPILASKGIMGKS